MAHWEAGRLALCDPPTMYRWDDLGFVNLPIVALLFVPLTWIGPLAAQLAFGVAGVGAVVAAWFVLARRGGLHGRRRWELACLFCLCGPLFYSVREGNLTHFLLIGLALALGCLERGKDALAGALLALAAFIKPPLLLVGGYFALRGRWRMTAAWGTVLVGALAVSVGLFGLDVHRAWYDSCVRPFSGRPMPAYNVQSVAGALARLLTDGDLGRGWHPLDVSRSFRLIHLAALSHGPIIICSFLCRPR